MSNNLRPDLTPSIDLSIHELAEIRGAILSVIDDGRLVKGKREPWSFYPDQKMKVLDALEEVELYLAEEQRRNVFEDSKHDERNAVVLYNKVRPALKLLRDNSDWRMDESGDCNDQRLDFCDEIQAYLTKKITQG